MKKARSRAKDDVNTNTTEEPQLSFCTWDGEALVVNILGKPSAKQNAIGKVKGTQLKVSVTASPEDGKATDCMVKFLAGEFDVPASAITVVFGQFSVNKQLRITSPKRLPDVIARALNVKIMTGDKRNSFHDGW